MRSRVQQSLTQGGWAVDLTLGKGAGITTFAGRGRRGAGRAGRGCFGSWSRGFGAQAKALAAQEGTEGPEGHG